MSYLKRKTPGGIWALRAVTIAISLLVISVIGGIVYSAYKDYNAVIPYISNPQHPAGNLAMQGTTGIVTFSVTVPNRGIFNLNVTVNCDSPPSGVTCHRASISVPPGQQQVLNFTMTIANVPQFAALQNHSINGTVSMGLVPFATLQIDVNFGGIIGSGGG